MTYEESAVLMTDAAFRGKVMVALLKYADTILIEADNTMGHTSRVRWAQQAMQQPQVYAQQLQPSVVSDPAIQQDGAAATDIQIQGATEAVINKTV